MFPNHTEEQILSAVPLEDAICELQSLQSEYGIELAVDGSIATCNEPRLDLATNFSTVRGIAGRVTRFVHEQQHVAALQRAAESESHWRARAKEHQKCKERQSSTAARYAAESAQREQARLRSCAGVGTHDLFSIGPTEGSTMMTDTEFVYSIRWRLGLPMQALPRTCQLRAIACKHTGEICGKPLDRQGDHPVLCGRGPGRYRVHNSIVYALRDVAREAGAQVEIEVVCPQLLQGEPADPEAKEARLDLHIWMPGVQGPQECWVDVSHIHPCRANMRKKAAAQDRAAAQEAEDRKRKRYCNGGGVFVYPFVVEAFGGLGDGSITLLDLCAAALSRKRRLSAQALSATVRRWRASIGAAAYRAQASIYAHAHSETAMRHQPRESDSDASDDL